MYITISTGPRSFRFTEERGGEGEGGALLLIPGSRMEAKAP